MVYRMTGLSFTETNCRGMLYLLTRFFPPARITAMLFLLSMVCAALAGGGDPVAFEWPAMGTRVRVLVRGENAAAAGEAMHDAARAAVEAVEAETSAFRADSAVARVSAAAGNGEWIATGKAFDAALDLALDVAEASGGAFNPLVAPLMEANGFARRPPGEKTATRITEPPTRALLDLAKIERRPGACRLAAEGMALDFGGVAKGLCADWAAAAAGAAATNDFLLDVGGNLVGRGEWTVGIRDPRGGAGAPPLRVFTLSDGMAVATSGNYERQVIRGDGTRMGHLFDPRTGRPLELTFDQTGSDTFYRQTAELFAEDLRGLGIVLKPEFNTKSRFFQKLNTGNVQLFRLSWTGDYPDAENFLQLFYGPNAGSCNRVSYRDSAYDAMYEEILSMPDSPARTEKYRKMARYAGDERRTNFTPGPSGDSARSAVSSGERRSRSVRMPRVPVRYLRSSTVSRLRP